MTKNTHKSGGTLLAILFIIFTSTMINYNLLYILMFFLGASFGSVLPDIDHEKAYISKRLPLLSKLIRSFTKHRGLTHSILFVLFIYSLTILSESNLINSWIIGIVVGCISHILLDLITKEGVCLFYPIDKRISIGRVRTGSLVEGKINILLNISNTLLIINIIKNIIF